MKKLLEELLEELEAHVGSAYCQADGDDTLELIARVKKFLGRE